MEKVLISLAYTFHSCMSSIFIPKDYFLGKLEECINVYFNVRDKYVIKYSYSWDREEISKYIRYKIGKYFLRSEGFKPVNELHYTPREYKINLNGRGLNTLSAEKLIRDELPIFLDIEHEEKCVFRLQVKEEASENIYKIGENDIYDDMVDNKGFKRFSEVERKISWQAYCQSREIEQQNVTMVRYYQY